jgi:hypothetical protein
MEIRVCECKKPLCRYRWIPRPKKDDVLKPRVTSEKYGVSETIEGFDFMPKECPSCKHQFSGCTWSVKAKCWIETVNNMNELKILKESIKKWNQEERFTASY